MVEAKIRDYLRPFTTTQLDAGTLGKIAGRIIEVKKKGYGTVTITICAGLITQVTTADQDRDINDFLI